MAVVITQLYTFVKTWEFTFSKLVYFTAYKLHSNKADLRKASQRRQKAGQGAALHSAQWEGVCFVSMKPAFNAQHGPGVEGIGRGRRGGEDRRGREERRGRGGRAVGSRRGKGGGGRGKRGEKGPRSYVTGKLHTVVVYI